MTYDEALREMRAGRAVRREVWHFACRAVLIDGEICQQLNGLICAMDSFDKIATDWEKN